MLNCHLFTRSSVISHGLGFFLVRVLWPDEMKLNLKDLPLQRREKQINPWYQRGTCFLLSPAVNRVITRETEPATRLTLDKVMKIRFSFRFVKVQLQLPIIALRRKRKGKKKKGLRNNKSSEQIKGAFLMVLHTRFLKNLGRLETFSSRFQKICTLLWELWHLALDS